MLQGIKNERTFEQTLWMYVDDKLNDLFLFVPFVDSMVS